jgi:hypothetical protein
MLCPFGSNRYKAKCPQRQTSTGRLASAFDQAVVLELFDDAHLVVDERSELVWPMMEPLAKTIVRAPRESGCVCHAGTKR